jgi:hypothetical protein
MVRRSSPVLSTGRLTTAAGRRWGRTPGTAKRMASVVVTTRPHRAVTLMRALPLPAGRQPTRHRVHRNITSGQQIVVQPRDTGQPAPNGPRRQTRGVIHQMRHRTVPAAALRGDEHHHIRRADRLHRLTHGGEEHLPVISRRKHSIRPGPSTDELQLVIQQRHTQPHHQVPGRPSRADQARIDERHAGASNPRIPNPRQVS